VENATTPVGRKRWRPVEKSEYWREKGVIGVAVRSKDRIKKGTNSTARKDILWRGDRVRGVTSGGFWGRQGHNSYDLY